nr:LuxR C-terminal-related transcriptional regulator [Rhizobium sp. BK376]
MDQEGFETEHDFGILQLLAEGAPTREIADRLNLSSRTIEHRIESLKSAVFRRGILTPLAG